MNEDRERIERLIAMGERLTAAIEADIAALKAGRPKEMRTLDPEIQRLSALYGREAQAFTLERAKAAPPDLRKKFLAVTIRFREILALHARLLTRIRNASEGIIKAVADEVERVRAPLTTYAPASKRAPGAMIYNDLA
ncbi:MAG: hypothetical protein KGJ78_04415 [Alphaproteobacteria bacterium]|nr:hypothetical protein [Alphaproteobacteria bacterium]